MFDKHDMAMGLGFAAEGVYIDIREGFQVWGDPVLFPAGVTKKILKMKYMWSIGQWFWFDNTEKIEICNFLLWFSVSESGGVSNIEITILTCTCIHPRELSSYEISFLCSFTWIKYVPIQRGEVIGKHTLTIDFNHKKDTHT